MAGDGKNFKASGLRRSPGSNATVHASELVVKPDLQILRRYRRPLLLRLEHPPRSALEDHVHRASRLGKRGLLNVRIGISWDEERLTSLASIMLALGNESPEI